MNDPRFEEERAAECAVDEPNIEKDLVDSHTVLALFRFRKRTGLRDLLPALLQIDSRLAKYQPAKGDQWRSKSINYHMEHALLHLSKAIQSTSGRVLTKNLAACALRCMMALVCTQKRNRRLAGTFGELRVSEERVEE